MKRPVPEKDIVDVNVLGIMVVKYDELHAAFKYYSKSRVGRSMESVTVSAVDEIIGNIYKNPELLK